MQINNTCRIVTTDPHSPTQPVKLDGLTTIRAGTRSIACSAFWLVWTLLLSPAILFFALYNRPKAIRAYVRFWTRGIVWSLKVINGISHTVISESAASDIPALYVSNHQSSFESVAFNLLVPDVAIIAKKELGKVPIFGWFLKRVPMILIDRDGGPGALRDLVRQCSGVLAEGRSILIFPEGTRVEPRSTVPFQAGLVAILQEFAVPCVPVVHDSGAYMSPHFSVRYAGQIRIRFFPPINPLDGDARTKSKALEAILNQEKQALLDDLELGERLDVNR